MSDLNLEQIEFKGLRNDKGRKFIGPEYFFSILNFNYDDLVGANKILMPNIVSNQNSTENEDGLFEFKYLDANNILQMETIEVRGGAIYKNWLSGSPQVLVSDLELGRCTFTIQNDKLFIANGKNYPKIYDGTAVWEMGAPKATVTTTAGNLNGTYYYEITYVTTGGEKRIGTRSNTITPTGRTVTLDLPIGFSGTTSRKIYRTTAGGNLPKLLTTIADNTTLTYTDNIADGSLGADIGPLNHECPKPYFLQTSKGLLVGGVFDIYPTQLFIAQDTLGELFDVDIFTDISNVGNDNTPVTGLAVQYSLVIASTEVNFYPIDVSANPVTPMQSKANVGCKDGYSIALIPDEENFTGGLMFVSTLNDIRVFNGNLALPVASSLDNLKTENWAQVIRGTLALELTTNVTLYGIFFDYKYHLIIGSKILIFDIRTRGWSVYQIKTDSFESIGNVFGIAGQNLYLGQKGASIIEQMYAATTYRNEDYTATLATPQLMVGKEVKFFADLYIYYTQTSQTEITVTITIEGDENNQIVKTLSLNGGSYSAEFYNSDFFETGGNEEDYKVIHISRYGRWIDFQIASDADIFLFRGYRLMGRLPSNKEG